MTNVIMVDNSRPKLCHIHKANGMVAWGRSHDRQATQTHTYN